MSGVNAIDWQRFLEINRDAALAVASGWSEAASRYVDWVNKESASRLLTESEKHSRFAAELGRAFKDASDKAAMWARAASDAGNTGIGNIMERYSHSFAAQADLMRLNGANALANLNALAEDIRSAAAKAPDALGGGFGRAIGPAFDAYSMMEGATEWVNTGKSEKFGGAAMGVVLSAFFGAVGAGLATFVGAPLIVVLVMAAAGATIGSAIGGEVFKEFRNLISGWLLGNPDPNVKIIQYVMVDPLVLDLDGDGLEITPLSQGVQFDGNGDTIRTNTSWASADDGLLALDRNGNGVIDSGRELFGDETLLADGKKAAHGFAALAELDVGGAANATGGAGDGVFDAKDAQYTNVRIWRDLNQDGISQANEMQTLAQAGIASIKLSSTKTDTSYGDAQLVQSGSFTRTDGSEGQAGSFILAQNNAVTTHAPIAISAEAQALPAIQGSGWVRDLREAATIKPQLLQCYRRQRQRRGHAGKQGYRVCGPRGRRRPSRAGDLPLHEVRHRQGQRGQGYAGRSE
jgi:hypothetical protein